jgi:hypothetical protein
VGASSSGTAIRHSAWCLLVASLYAAGAAAAEHYEGLAYARGSDRLLYRESHWIYAEAGVTRRLVLYRCPTGAPFARKQLSESPTGTAPDFDFFDNRDGYREGVRTVDGARQIYVQENAHSTMDTRPLAKRDGAVIDAGFDLFVRNHWSEFSSGSSLTVPFLVPSRFGYLDLKISNSHTGVLDGQPVRQVRMGLAAWYSFALPSIDLAYDPDGLHLLEFQGIGTIRDKGKKQQDVRIVFPPAARVSDVPRADIDRAAAEALTAQCDGG